MLRRLDLHVSTREALVGHEIADVIRDLLLLDPADMIAFLRLGQIANLESLVTSSIELLFAPGTLRFGHGGSAEISWGASPVVTLDMEFHHLGVEAYFRLCLSAGEQRVVLDYVRFAGARRSPSENSVRLAMAMRDARIGW
jgi:hypothetical protein